MTWGKGSHFKLSTSDRQCWEGGSCIVKFNISILAGPSQSHVAQSLLSKSIPFHNVLPFLSAWATLGELMKSGFAPEILWDWLVPTAPCSPSSQHLSCCSRIACLSVFHWVVCSKRAGSLFCLLLYSQHSAHPNRGPQSVFHCRRCCSESLDQSNWTSLFANYLTALISASFTSLGMLSLNLSYPHYSDDFL